MYELVQVAENTFYIQSPAKVGIYRENQNDVWLIDSGNDKDAGRRIRKVLDEQGWRLKGIINTHSNADHIGGNRYLQNNTGCRAFARGIEKTVTENPVVEPSFLYGGYPFRELRGKFLMAQESVCDELDESMLPEGFRIVDLPGHFFHMVGVITPDDVFFIADCMVGSEIIEKYPVSFVYDVEEYIRTIKKVRDIECGMYIPSHGQPCEDIGRLADDNLMAVEKTEKIILECIENEITSEDVIKLLSDRLGQKLTYEQYVLTGSTVRSYLSWMKDRGIAECRILDNRLCWKAVKE